MAEILVVDDDSSFLEECRLLLESSGFSVRCAPNGKKGLDLVRQRIPDLIVADLEMPEMDGLSFLMHARKEFPNLRVIVISGHTMADTFLKTAQKLGAQFTMTKPFDPQEFMRRVKFLVDGI